MVSNSEVAAKVKLSLKRLYNVDLEVDDSNLLDVVDEAGQAILNYCNLQAIPRELFQVWKRLSLDLYAFELAMKKANTGEGTTPSLASVVTGITEGDASISLAVDASSQNAKALSAHNVASGVDGFILDYKDQLNRYRRVVW